MNPMQFETKTLSADAIVTHLTSSGVSTRDAALIASAWIYQNIAQIQRSFLYGAEFPAVDTHCVPSFAQTFQHKDWVDGEDVVQAGASATDEGFNSRLHKIEADIGALGAEIAKIYTCMADTRANLAARLEEIRVELNRIDSELPSDKLNPPPSVWPPRNFAGLVENTSFVGVSQIDKQAVQIWKTDRGMMLLPQVQPIPGDPTVDRHVQDASAFANFASSNEVQNAFGGHAFSKADVIAKFGDQTLSTGAKVADVVSSLPSTAQFGKVDDVVSAVGEQSALTLKQQVGVPEALAQSLNLTASATSFGGASVDALSTLAEPQRAALKAAGVTTVAQLAATDNATISQAFTRAGITNVGVGDVAAVKQTAHIINLMHR